MGTLNEAMLQFITTELISIATNRNGKEPAKIKALQLLAKAWNIESIYPSIEISIVADDD